jgi:hypothetical protein
MLDQSINGPRHLCRTSRVGFASQICISRIRLHIRLNFCRKVFSFIWLARLAAIHRVERNLLLPRFDKLAASARRGASSALLLRLLDRSLFRLFQCLSLSNMKPRSCVRRICWTEMRNRGVVLDFLLSVNHLPRRFLHGAQRFPIRIMTLFLNWRLPPIVDILLRIMSGIFADQRNGESLLSRRLTSSNLLRHRHEHRNHSDA